MNTKQPSLKRRMFGRVLGELETEIMEIIWAMRKPVTVSHVFTTLAQRRKIAYTTVMTVMGRLVQKGILTRSLPGTTYVYQPKVSQEKFIAKSVHSIFVTAVSTLGQEAVLHFANEIQKLHPQKREELLKMLDKDK